MRPRSRPEHRHRRSKPHGECDAYAGSNRAPEPQASEPPQPEPQPQPLRELRPPHRSQPEHQSRRSQPCEAQTSQPYQTLRLPAQRASHQRRDEHGGGTHAESHEHPQCAGPHAQHAWTPEPSARSSPQRSAAHGPGALPHNPHGPNGTTHPQCGQDGQPSEKHEPSPHRRESPQNDPRSG